jgi:hypothetical protein
VSGPEAQLLPHWDSTTKNPSCVPPWGFAVRDRTDAGFFRHSLSGNHSAVFFTSCSDPGTKLACSKKGGISPPFSGEPNLPMSLIVSAL